jgi:hypothetical protein
MGFAVAARRLWTFCPLSVAAPAMMVLTNGPFVFERLGAPDQFRPAPDLRRDPR